MAPSKRLYLFVWLARFAKPAFIRDTVCESSYVPEGFSDAYAGGYIRCISVV
jgi:hypothetical protein